MDIFSDLKEISAWVISLMSLTVVLVMVYAKVSRVKAKA
jgi:hypothetical protein